MFGTIPNTAKVGIGAVEKEKIKHKKRKSYGGMLD